MTQQKPDVCQKLEDDLKAVLKGSFPDMSEKERQELADELIEVGRRHGRVAVQ